MTVQAHMPFVDVIRSWWRGGDWRFDRAIVDWLGSLPLGREWLTPECF